MKAALSIVDSTRDYESWLRAELPGEVVEKDLRAKHDKMRKGVFPFLRATYWRWAQTILDTCPELAGAPAVLAVGDIHLENFGSWRDADGRLVWGVNDFDEAAEMPYVLDLLRLATSAVLGCPGAGRHEEICDQVVKGYAKGLQNPHAIVLDHDYAWLRKLVVVPERERAAFWKKMAALAAGGRHPPPRYAQALMAALPAPGIALAFAPRAAGAGSLGRPRWVGIGDWHGAPVVREAKAVVPSAWTLAGARAAQAHRCYEIAAGRYRAPDPWYRLTGNIVVRRLSPNNRKIEAADHPIELTGRKMLRAMGHELASIHCGQAAQRTAIARDLGRRKRRWLATAVERAAEFVRADFKAWKNA